MPGVALRIDLHDKEPFALRFAHHIDAQYGNFRNFELAQCASGINGASSGLIGKEGNRRKDQGGARNLPAPSHRIGRFIVADSHLDVARSSSACEAGFCSADSVGSIGAGNSGSCPRLRALSARRSGRSE
jgi:hypothetical protein